MNEPDCVIGAVPDWSLTSTFSASSEADPVEAPVENLKTRNLFDWWRSASASEPDCVLDVALAPAVFQPNPIKLLSIGAIGGNLSQSARIRVSVSNAHDLFVPDRVRLAPDSVSGSDYAGTVVDIDEDPTAPDGAELIPVDASQGMSSALIGFPAPVSLSPARLVHTARALVQLKSAGLMSIETRVNLYLSEGGADVRLLRSVTLRGSDADTDVLIRGHFSADEISDPASLELRVERDIATSGGSSADVRIKAVDLEYQEAPPAGIHDTGFVDVWPAILQDGFELIHPSEVRSSSVPWIYNFRDAGGEISPVDALRMRVEIMDPDNPDGFVELAALPFGPGLAARFLGRNLTLQPVDLRSQILRTAGDRDLAAFGATRGGANLRLAPLTREQAYGSVLRYLGQRAWPENFLLSLLPDDEDFRTELRMFGHLAGRPAGIQHMPGSRGLYSASIAFEEAR
ncbi:MAG: hypothetical protein AAF604_04605 [Acidobacteriota bacterium]